MIVRVTDIVMSYKFWQRKRLIKKVMLIKKQLKSHHGKKDKAYQLKHGLLRKSTNVVLARHSELGSNAPGSKASQQRISRYSSVNIAMLNNMRTNDTVQNEEIEKTLSKPTKLELRVSMLTIKRTMT